MTMRSVYVAALLATSSVAGGCLLAPLPSDPPSEVPLASRKVEAVAVKGSVFAPANVIAAGGGNVIATGGGNLIGQAGGNVVTSGDVDVIATGGGNMKRRVLAGASPAIAGAKVFLADGHGNPLRGLTAVKTDATGTFNFPRVPAGHGFMIVAEFTTKKGEVARLRTLTRPSKIGTVADVDAATSLVTSALARGEVGALGEFSTELFARARDTARAELEAAQLPDWRKPAAVDTAVDQLVAGVPALKADVEILRGELKTPSKPLESLEADLAALDKAPAPSAAPVAEAPWVPAIAPVEAPPTPGASVAPSTAPAPPTPPAPVTVTDRLLDDIRLVPPGTARWRYRAVHRISGAAWGPGTRFDAQHPQHMGNLVMYLGGLTGTPADNGDYLWKALAFGSETLLAHPGATQDVIVDWIAPASGRATLSYDLQASAESVDGVRVVVTSPGGAAVDQVLLGRSLTASGERTATLQAGQTWSLRVGSHTGNTTGDGTTVKAIVTFTPDR